jgi:hypothetical protein
LGAISSSANAPAVGPDLHLLAQRVDIPGHDEDQEGVDNPQISQAMMQISRMALPSDKPPAVTTTRCGTPVREKSAAL